MQACAHLSENLEAPVASIGRTYAAEPPAQVDTTDRVNALDEKQARG